MVIECPSHQRVKHPETYPAWLIDFRNNPILHAEQIARARFETCSPGGATPVQSLADLAEQASSAATPTGDTPIERALKPDRTPMLFPDLPLDNTLHYFPRWPLLPILNRANKSKLEGVMALDDVLKRYQEL